MNDRWKNEKQLVEQTSTSLIQESLRAGAERAEVCISLASKTKISFEKQDFHLASSDEGLNYGLRVLIGDRQGFVTGNSTLKKDIKDASQLAVRIAKVSPKNEFNCIEPSENVSTETPAGFYDDALVDLSIKSQRELAKGFLGEATRDKRLLVNEGHLGVDAGILLVANSMGTHKLHLETSATWSLMGMGADGDKLTSFDYFSGLSRSVKDLPKRLVHDAGLFRDELVAQLTTGPAESYLGPVVFSPRAVLDVLARPLLYHLSGRNLVEGSTKWKPSQLGNEVLSPFFSVSDDPWNVDRFGACPFDREGTPTRPLALISEGRIRGFALDRYSARALALAVTGNALGSAATIPTSGTHCVRVGPGNLKLDDFFKTHERTSRGILKVNRFSGRTDPVTGDFSGVAKGAEWWVNGSRRHFAQETVISGNIYDALGKSLLGISPETQSVNCTADAPHLVADNISVTWGRA